MFYKSGVYLIKNHQTSTLYIGKSNNVFKRLNQHKRELKKGVHNNRQMQAAYTLSPGAFSFKILFNCDPDDVSYYEALVLNQAIEHGYSVYNVVKNPFKDVYVKQRQRLELYADWGITTTDPKLSNLNAAFKN